MKQAWYEKKEKERKQLIEKLTEEIRSKLLGFKEWDLSEEDVQAFIDRAYEVAERGFNDDGIMMIPKKKKYMDKLFSSTDFFMKAETFLDSLPYSELSYAIRQNNKMFLDSEKKHFHGDIIITDPCYVIKDDDWSEVCDHLFHDENDLDPIYPFILGSITRGTLYGDWSCTTYDTIHNKEIGQFCADAGLVSVFELDKVLAYNPDFDYHLKRNWTTTWIKDFDGDVWFEVTYSRKYKEYSVHVCGKGKNIKTEEPIEFTTRQTGL